jgi:hypothetical protein
MIDPNAVDRALIGKLAGDAELTALLPGGVFWDLAPLGTTAFVLVSLMQSRGLPELDGADTFRDFVYLVKAVALGSSSAPTAAADARIQALLDHGDLDLSGSGGDLMVMRWVERVRYTEATAQSDIWQHRGGRYEVMVTPSY